MLTMRQNQLQFSFPQVHPSASARVQFQRTLRIPDDDRRYPLPPGLGAFALRHVDDFAENLPPEWLTRGGVMLPMWQAEAMWISFSGSYDREREVTYPCAVKVAAGKRSAVTGKAWQAGLGRDPQDYVVVPIQPWLDGFCVEKGVIRQFVAMPLGQGYTVEEQIDGKAEFGGLQIEVFPMKREVFERRFPIPVRQPLPAMPYRAADETMMTPCASPEAPGAAMGMGAGGQMRQEISCDPYDADDWDISQGQRCFVHLCNSASWQQITGQPPPSKPPTARAYASAGLPWFEYYSDTPAVSGGALLGAIKSVFALGKAKGEQPLPENQAALPKVVHGLGPKREGDDVRVGEF